MGLACCGRCPSQRWGQPNDCCRMSSIWEPEIDRRRSAQMAQIYLNHILASMLCQATKSTLRARTTTGAETGSRPSCAGVLWVHDEQQKYHLLTVFAIYEYLGPASTPNIDPYTLATFGGIIIFMREPLGPKQSAMAPKVSSWRRMSLVGCGKRLDFIQFPHGKSRPNPFHH